MSWRRTLWGSWRWHPGRPWGWLDVVQGWGSAHRLKFRSWRARRGRSLRHSGTGRSHSGGTWGRGRHTRSLHSWHGSSSSVWHHSRHWRSGHSWHTELLHLSLHLLHHLRVHVLHHLLHHLRIHHCWVHAREHHTRHHAGHSRLLSPSLCSLSFFPFTLFSIPDLFLVHRYILRRDPFRPVYLNLTVVTVGEGVWY